MASLGELSPEGTMLLLSGLMGQELPKELYVGLARMPSLDPDLKELAKLEIVGLTYARQKIAAGDWRVMDSKKGWKGLQSRLLYFENRSNEPWPPADVSFLCTSEDDSGVLLLWQGLRVRRQLLPAEDIHFPWVIRLRGIGV
jgi:hypothetical protein